MMESLAAALGRVTVQIVAYNSREALQRQQALLAQLPRLTVIENGGRDDLAAWMAEALPQARCLSLPANIGFGRAHNLGVTDCETPFALLLNPDCVIQPEAIVQLLHCLEAHPDALMSVPALRYPDGRLQENHRGFFHTRGSARGSYDVPAGETCCEMVSGAVLMVRVETFRRIGGFDPWFFLYWEDEELCIRARQQRLAVILAPQATACHVAQTSSAPSTRTTFLRHYCYTGSKLYLRRKLGEGLPLVCARALGTLLPSLLSLPWLLLSGQRVKAVRNAARAVAVLTAPWQLRRARSAALPSQLWRD